MQSPESFGRFNSANDEIVLIVAGYAGVAVQITGTWAGTIVFEGSVDGYNFVAIQLSGVASGAGVTSATANGVWAGATSGLRLVRARMSVFTSGIATVSLKASQAAGAGGGSGGGGGGAVTIADGADIAEGATTDAAVITDTTGTLSGKLRGLVKWAFERMPASLGQKTMAASLPVTMASDQTPIEVSLALAEIQANQGDAGVDPWPVEFATPQAVTGPLTDVQLRASAVPVSAASLPLPTGAATAARQDTGNASVASIDTKTPALGQAAMAASVPVAIASNQSAVPVSMADGSDVAEGATTSAAVQGDNTGSVNARLRGLSIILNDVWDSVNNRLNVFIENATLAVTQSGSWVLSAGAAIIGKVGIDQTTPGTTNGVVVNSSALPTGAATAANQQTDALTDTELRASAVPVSTASLPLPTGAATLAEQQLQTASLAVLDDWDESDRAKVNPIVGQAGVQGGAGAVTALTQRVAFATDANVVQGAGVAGTPAGGVVSVQGAAGGTALPVSAASLPLPSGAATETSVAATAAVAGVVSGAAVITDANGTLQQYLRGLVKLAITAGGWLASVTGTVADDATTPGNPVMVGGMAKSPDGTDPGNVDAENDTARAILDLNRRQYVNTEHPQWWSFHSDGSAALTDAAVAADPGDGFQLVITEIIFSTGAATACNLFFEEGSTKILGPWYLEAVAGRGVIWRGRKHVTPSTALTATTSAAIAQSLDVQGYTQKV